MLLLPCSFAMQWKVKSPPIYLSPSERTNTMSSYRHQHKNSARDMDFESCFAMENIEHTEAPCYPSSPSLFLPPLPVFRTQQTQLDSTFSHRVKAPGNVQLD
jgi:hypothetical protein